MAFDYPRSAANRKRRGDVGHKGNSALLLRCPLHCGCAHWHCPLSPQGSCTSRKQTFEYELPQKSLAICFSNFKAREIMISLYPMSFFQRQLTTLNFCKHSDSCLLFPRGRNSSSALVVHVTCSSGLFTLASQQGRSCLSSKGFHLASISLCLVPCTRTSSPANAVVTLLLARLTEFSQDMFVFVCFCLGVENWRRHTTNFKGVRNDALIALLQAEI